jgi:hypothetical protein
MANIQTVFLKNKVLMSYKLFILNKMFEYMSENNQNTSFNLSDSPEYVDVFNDEMSTRATIPSLCDNNTAVGGGIACVGTGATCICTGATCVSTGATTGVTTGTSTAYSIAFSLGFNVYTTYSDGTRSQCTRASTSSLWGRKIKAQYLGPNRYGVFFSGQTYQFTQDVTDSPNKNSYYHNGVISCGNSSCATTIENVLKTTTFDFKITFFAGHEVPYNFSIGDGTGVGVLVTSGKNLSIVTFPAISASLSISALTYNTVYTSGTSSTATTEALRNSKIGTKYTVTTVSGNKTAKTVSGGSYVYSTSCVSDTTSRMLRPHNPFFIQTSAQSLTIKYERMGSVSSEETYDLSSYSNLVLPIQENNYRLATMGDISNTNGLGISMFNNMFDSRDANFKSIVITPNYYSNSLTTRSYSANTSYKYYKPALFFKAASTNNDYCLRMNDISTFDKWMYMVGMVSNSATTLTNNNFDYKNYDSANVKNGRDWATTFTDKNRYFTLILK